MENKITDSGNLTCWSQRISKGDFNLIVLNVGKPTKVSFAISSNQGATWYCRYKPAGETEKRVPIWEWGGSSQQSHPINAIFDTTSYVILEAPITTEVYVFYSKIEL